MPWPNNNDDDGNADADADVDLKKTDRKHELVMFASFEVTHAHRMFACARSAMHDWRIILRCERLNCGRPKERPGGNDTQRNEREHPIEMRFGKEHHEAPRSRCSSVHGEGLCGLGRERER